MPARLIDRAYAAGLFDGEGHAWIGLRSSKGRRCERFGCMLQMMDVRPIAWLAEVFGGGTGSYCSIHPNHARMYHWQVYSKTAAAFIAAILPFVKVKGPELEIAQAFWETVNHYGRAGVPQEVQEQRSLLMSKLKEYRHARKVQAMC